MGFIRQSKQMCCLHDEPSTSQQTVLPSSQFHIRRFEGGHESGLEY